MKLPAAPAVFAVIVTVLAGGRRRRREHALAAEAFRFDRDGVVVAPVSV